MSSELDLTPPPGAVVRFRVEKGQKFWLEANRAGWVHLAYLCTDLGKGNHEDGYHFHRNLSFGDGNARAPEISFGIPLDLA